MTTNTISPLVAKFKQLQIEGYCVLENIADNALLERTRACAEQAVATAKDAAPSAKMRIDCGVRKV